MKIKNLNEKILSNLKSYPYLTSIPELTKKLNVSYGTIHFRLMGLLGDRKVGYIKKGGNKFFFTPYRDDIDECKEKKRKKLRITRLIRFCVKSFIDIIISYTIS